MIACGWVHYPASMVPEAVSGRQLDAEAVDFSMKSRCDTVSFVNGEYFLSALPHTLLGWSNASLPTLFMTIGGNHPIICLMSCCH